MGMNEILKWIARNKFLWTGYLLILLAFGLQEVKLQMLKAEMRTLKLDKTYAERLWKFWQNDSYQWQEKYRVATGGKDYYVKPGDPMPEAKPGDVVWFTDETRGKYLGYREFWITLTEAGCKDGFGLTQYENGLLGWTTGVKTVKREDSDTFYGPAIKRTSSHD